MHLFANYLEDQEEEVAFTVRALSLCKCFVLEQTLHLSARNGSVPPPAPGSPGGAAAEELLFQVSHDMMAAKLRSARAEPVRVVFCQSGCLPAKEFSRVTIPLENNLATVAIFSARC